VCVSNELREIRAACIVFRLKAYGTRYKSQGPTEMRHTLIIYRVKIISVFLAGHQRTTPALADGSREVRLSSWRSAKSRLKPRRGFYALRQRFIPRRTAGCQKFKIWKLFLHKFLGLTRLALTLRTRCHEFSQNFLIQIRAKRQRQKALDLKWLN